MPELHDMLERRASGYEPPPDLFDRVLDRRRRRDRNRRIGTAVVALMLAAATIGGLARAFTSGRGPVPADQPPPLLTERFDSPLHGLSIGYPSGWRTRAATEPFTTEPWGHGAVAFGAPDVDVIFHPTLRDDLYFALVSEPLGRSGRDWVDDLVLPTSVGICKGNGWGGGNDTFHDHYAWFLDCGEPHGARGHVVIVATATRGYILYLRVGDDPLLQATYDQDWFEAALDETVDLRPEDALDASNPSESP